jgi:phosphoacetylglucosamine mutase
LNIEMRNNGNVKLNENVGADYVKVNRAIPQGVDPRTDRTRKLCSVDGDADRLVYYYISSKGEFRLLDGDKITALAAGYLQEVIKASGLSLNMGVVQTAYANGASTIYLEKQLGKKVECQPTGVKFVHAKAEEFDVGIYFEANGHGTVLFSPHAQQIIHKALSSKSGTAAQLKAIRQLEALTRLINQCIGDAVSDMLLVEVILANKGMTLMDWDAYYEDLPSKLMKCAIKDRSVVKTTDAERRCTEPKGLQAVIDGLCDPTTNKEHPLRRCFVRPSGTEDVVRIYAESDTLADAEWLGKKVEEAVLKYAGGK